MINGDFPMINGDFPMINGDFPMKNGDFPMKNGDFPMINGDSLQSYVTVCPRVTLAKPKKTRRSPGLGATVSNYCDYIPI